MLERVLIFTQVDYDGNVDNLTAMGFTVLHNFDEISCDAGTFEFPP